MNPYVIDQEARNFIASIDVFELLQGLPGGFSLVSRDGRVLFSNKGQYKILGIEHLAELEHLVQNEGMNAKDLEKAIENNMKVLRSETPAEFIERVRFGRKALFLLAHKVPLRDKITGKVVGVYSYTSNITEERRMQKNLERTVKHLNLLTQTQNRFIASLSHDLRTPLAGLVGMIDLITVKTNNPQILRYGQLARDAVRGMVAYFEQIAAAEKAFQMGADCQEQAVIHVKEFLDSVGQIYLPILELKCLTYEVFSEVDVPISVMPSALSAVLMNLIANAAKYTVTGGIKVKARLVTWRGQTMVAFRVEDTGPGIPLKYRKKIFEPFFRIGREKKANIQGAGLGLSIAKRHAKNMDGQLTYAADENARGAIFECMIPFHPCPEQPTQKITMQDLHPFEIATYRPIIAIDREMMQQPLQAKIALVEDNLVVAKAVLDMVQHYYPDLSVAHYADAETFLESCRAGFSPELIFLDIGLPEMQGNELASILRKENLLPKCQAMIAVTGHGMTLPGIVDAKVFDGIWAKPVSKERLFGMLDICFKLRKKVGVKQDVTKEVMVTLPHDEIKDLLKASFLEVMPVLASAIIKPDWTILQKKFHFLKGGLSFANEPLLLGVVTLCDRFAQREDLRALRCCYYELVVEVEAWLAEIQTTA